MGIKVYCFLLKVNTLNGRGQSAGTNLPKWQASRFPHAWSKIRFTRIPPLWFGSVRWTVDGRDTRNQLLGRSPIRITQLVNKESTVIVHAMWTWHCYLEGPKFVASTLRVEVMSLGTETLVSIICWNKEKELVTFPLPFLTIPLLLLCLL